MKPLYKSMLLLGGAMAMMSSCDDFLDRPSEDSYTENSYLSNDKALMNYTFQIYGPKSWNEYEDKFSWCVGEVYSGNVYHEYGDEGQFHFLTFSNTNAHIQNGYTSLYGVIARCNHIINDVVKVCKENGISEAAINRAKGEAYMYRGMAYFLLEEYWGATPIVLNNTEIINNDKAFDIPLANRASLYAQIESDWKQAEKLLPAEAWGNKGERVTKWAAKGMLSKLYVTMASCRADIKGVNKYKCENPEELLKKAVSLSDEVIAACGSNMTQGYEAYDLMFRPGTANPEILFALRMDGGDYGIGSSRQVQFGRSKFIGCDDDAYGGGKGLTTTLFNSYENGDIRKKATCYYQEKDLDGNYTDAKVYQDYLSGADNYYTTADGKKYYYFLNPNKSIKKSVRDDLYGDESDNAVMNHCRKFVHRYPTQQKFSVPASIPFLRVADVYLLNSEAKMMLENPEATAEISGDALSGINVVRKRAGLEPKTSVAFYTPDTLAENALTATTTVTVDEVEKKLTATCDVYKFAYDLMAERRWEFALECQNWLDIKRLYYRNADYAKSYVKEQDRQFCYANTYNSDIKPVQARNHYQRKKLAGDLSEQAHKLSSDYDVAATETEIKYDNISWFLPLPAIVHIDASKATDFTKEIKAGKYKY